MSNIKFVDLEKVSTLEEYAMHLVTCTVGLSTLVRLQILACQKGLLQPEEVEIANAIAYEGRRIGQYIQKMMDSIQERSPVDTAKIVELLKTQIPENQK